MTRSDMASAVHTMAKRCDSPREARWKAVTKALQYLLRTKELGLTNGAPEANGGVSVRRLGSRDLPRHQAIGAVLLGRAAAS